MMPLNGDYSDYDLRFHTDLRVHKRLGRRGLQSRWEFVKQSSQSI